jgi:predicted glycoside hydrolase/deacetylase ChbG (UPF0249 family)
MSQVNHGTTNRLLGYPADAKLLLINADDFGMYPAINAAVVRAFTGGVVRSTSLMVPCPGAPEAMQLLKEHPDLPFGVHLSFIRDIPDYRWGPLASREQVPSLLAEDGELYTLDQMEELLARARLDELEIEFRAQIEVVLAAGLQPTHLDWHCLLNGGRADVFDLSWRLAREYGLALRVDSRSYLDQSQRLDVPIADHELLDSFSLNIPDKAARYAALLRALPAGLTEWAVHPGGDDVDTQRLDPGGWQVRYSDFEWLTSPEARALIAREGITLLDYRPLQAVWRR